MLIDSVLEFVWIVRITGHLENICHQFVACRKMRNWSIKIHFNGIVISEIGHIRIPLRFSNQLAKLNALLLCNWSVGLVHVKTNMHMNEFLMLKFTFYAINIFVESFFVVVVSLSSILSMSLFWVSWHLISLSLSVSTAVKTIKSDPSSHRQLALR